MAFKRTVGRHNRLRPDAKPGMTPSTLCRRWRHIGGASVTRRLRRDARAAEKGRMTGGPAAALLTVRRKADRNETGLAREATKLAAP
jgi:hypothetical protein